MLCSSNGMEAVVVRHPSCDVIVLRVHDSMLTVRAQTRSRERRC